MPVSIDPDQQKNEETTKLRHITPVISERWQDVDKVLMEYYFTDGRISVDEYNMAHRGKPKKADYLLLYRDNIPLAIVEAKAIDHSADEGYPETRKLKVQFWKAPIKGFALENPAGKGKN